MDLTLTPEQEMLQRQAREFLDAECPKSLVRDVEASDRGDASGLWRQMAELGWLGFALPTEYGGDGASLVDNALLYEELGRALAPGPYLASSVLGARTILGAGNEAQKKELVPKVARGELVLTVAQLEQSQESGPEAIMATARREGDGYVLDGIKLFVPNASLADLIIVAARTGSNPTDISLFLVEPGTPGLSIRAMSTFANDRPGEVILEGVRLGPDRRLGALNAGWAALEAANNVATVMLCAEMVGGMQSVLDMSVEYAKQRVQFGRPIGAFQAIQHKAVAMVMEATGARMITYQTAWRLEHGVATAADVALCKAKCNQAYRLVTFEGHEIHGGIGWTSEYDLQLYFKRRTVAELQFGTTSEHLETVAQAVEGGALPAPHH